MPNYFKGKLKILKNKWVIGGLIILALFLIYIFTRGGGASNIESTAVTRNNVIEKVSVTGAVSPIDRADLAFEKSGVIKVVAVKVGDTVKRGDLIASLDNTSDIGALQSAEAQLAELTRGLRPEEYAVDQASLLAASTTLDNGTKDAINTLRDAYAHAQSAVLNYADTFFNNSQSSNPTVNISTESVQPQAVLNQERLAVTYALFHWKTDNDTATTTNVSSLVLNAEGYLTTIKSFMSDLSSSVINLKANNSDLSQSVIDSDISTINTALSSLNQAVTSVTTADSTLRSATASYNQAYNTFTLQKAGSSAETISAQEAKVLQAQAVVNGDSIFSTIDGLVTKADPNVGEFATAGQSGFAVQSSGNYKIEAFVPEADIAKVALKNKANVTLDAYGQYVIFPATVTAVDPAETILSGVPTYKVTLMFDTPDNRIRSGMTANTDILTYEADNVLVVPTRAIVDDNGKKTIRILNPDKKTFTSVPVTAGLKGSDGTTEITSGVSEGQVVVTYVK